MGDGEEGASGVIVHVVWHTKTPGISCRGFWDQGWLEEIFAGTMWRFPAYTFVHHYGFSELPPDVDGAIVIIPARHHLDDIEYLNEVMAPLSWVLLVLTGDEEGVFPLYQLTHPNLSPWVQTPYPDRHATVTGRVGDFATPGTRALLRSFVPDLPRPIAWSFVGQDNNARRTECIEALRYRQREHQDGILLATPGFTLGLDRSVYLGIMASSRIVACPSGSFTPDTFRLFEALEAGCIPIVDNRAPNQPEDVPASISYWPFLFGEPPPFPVLDYWDDFSYTADSLLSVYPASANRIYAWYQAYKREFVYRFFADLAVVSGVSVPTSPFDVTVIVPTSPIPSHPSTSILEQTIGSIRGQLPTADIILCFDGVRDEQEPRRADYEEYQRRALWLCNNVWSNVLPLRFADHIHQSNLTDAALHHVYTSAVLFVEHDTPLIGTIPWPNLISVIRSGEANVIRLHHEAEILDVHRYLMLDDEPTILNDVPMTRTVQWSQRPHLASTSYYRDLLKNHFDLPHEKWMIEDRMFGVVESAHHDHGEEGWNQHRLWIYTPPGDIKRSTHLDGRGEDPKWPDS